MAGVEPANVLTFRKKRTRYQGLSSIIMVASSMYYLLPSIRLTAYHLLVRPHSSGLSH
nr:MAG TPA: hypothetical protein [Caudoviricetes sp.]